MARRMTRVPFGNWLRVRFNKSWIMHINALRSPLFPSLSLCLSRKHISLNLYDPRWLSSPYKHTHALHQTERGQGCVCLSHLLIRAVGVRNTPERSLCRSRVSRGDTWSNKDSLSSFMYEGLHSDGSLLGLSQIRFSILWWNLSTSFLGTSLGKRVWVILPVHCRSIMITDTNVS